MTSTPARRLTCEPAPPAPRVDIDPVTLDSVLDVYDYLYGALEPHREALQRGLNAVLQALARGASDGQASPEVMDDLEALCTTLEARLARAERLIHRAHRRIAFLEGIYGWTDERFELGPLAPIAREATGTFRND